MAANTTRNSRQEFHENPYVTSHWIQNDIVYYVHRREGNRDILEEQSSVYAYAYSGSELATIPSEEIPRHELGSGEPSEADQSWYWTKEWQKLEAEADEDFRAGRYDDFESMDDFIAALREDMAEE